MKSFLILLLLFSTTQTSKQDIQNLRILQPGSNNGSSKNNYDYSSVNGIIYVPVGGEISILNGIQYVI